MQFSSIQPIDWTLSGTTSPAQSGPTSNGNEGVQRIPKAPALLEPHHPIIYCSIKDTRWCVLPLCIDAVGVFYSPSQLGNIEIVLDHI